MTISYPLDFPESLKFDTANITLAFTNGETRSPFTMVDRQVFSWGGECWKFSFNGIAMIRSEIAEWRAFANKLRGNYGTFLLGDYSCPNFLGVGGGSPVVDGGAQTGYELAIRGCPANILGWLLKDTYFSYGSGANMRLHQLVEDADTDADGKVVLNFVPALRYSPQDGAALTITEAKGVFCLDSNSVNTTVDKNQLFHFSFDATEVVTNA